MIPADAIQKEIADLRAGGFSENEIADYYTKELAQGGVTPQEIKSFISENGIKAGMTPAQAIPTTTAPKPELSLGRRIGEPMLESLPAAGATAGALIGLPGLALGPWGAVAPVAGAAGGGVAGKSLENTLRGILDWNAPKTASESLIDPLKTGANMGLFEMAGGPAMKIIEKVVAPFAAALAKNPEAQKLLSFSKEQNVPLSPSTILPTKTTKTLEGAVNMFPTGKMVTSHFQDKTYQAMMNMRNNLFSELTGTPLPAGQGMRSGTGEIAMNIRTGTKAAYQGIEDAAASASDVIPMDTTKAYFDQIYDQANPKVKALIEDFRTRSANGGMNVKEFNSWQAKINRASAKSGNLDLGTTIWEQVNKDLASYDQANGAAIMDAIKGAKMNAQMEARYGKISGLFQKASKTMPDGSDGFNASLFRDLIYNPKNQKMLIKEFGEDTLKNMKDFADMAVTMSGESAKRTMSDAQKYIGAPLVGGGGIAAAIYNPWLAVPHGMAPAMAYSMMKPRGAFKTWLTEGFKVGEAAKQGLMIGGRTAISKNEKKPTGYTGSW